jgi:hypothetical protein
VRYTSIWLASIKKTAHLPKLLMPVLSTPGASGTAIMLRFDWANDWAADLHMASTAHFEAEYLE